MRILVVSDNHGKWKNLKRALEREEPIDLMIHLGDSEFVEEKIEDVAGCPVAMVAGNCDFFSSLPKERTVEIPGHKLFLTHGHTYEVNWSATNLGYAAEEAGADFVLFGHTHVPVLEYDGKLTFLNPGSLEQPRQPNHLCSYAVMVLDPKGRVHIEIKYFKS